MALVATGGGAWYYVRSIERSIDRVDAFTGVPEADRPTKEPAATKALNLLVLGSDTRDPETAATELRNLRAGDLTFITNPSRGTGMVGDQSVVFADGAAATSLYRAVNEDAVRDWLAAHPGAAN